MKVAIGVLHALAVLSPKSIFFHFIKGGSCTSSYEGLRAPCLIFGTYPPMPVFRGKQAACRAGVSHTCVRSYVRVLYAVNTCKKVYERQLRRCTRVVHKENSRGVTARHVREMLRSPQPPDYASKRGAY
jgi:hypothetical protein